MLLLVIKLKHYYDHVCLLNYYVIGYVHVDRQTTCHVWHSVNAYDKVALWRLC